MSEAKIKGFVFVAKYKQDPKVLTYSFAGSTINDYLLTVPVVDYDELQRHFWALLIQKKKFLQLKNGSSGPWQQRDWKDN